MNCSVVSNPPSIIQWYRTDLNTNTTLLVSTNNQFDSLTISWQPNMNASVLYSCRAVNQIGYSPTTEATVFFEEEPLTSVVISDNIDLIIGVSSGIAALVLMLMSMSFILYRKYSTRTEHAPELTPNDEFVYDPERSIFDQISELPYNVHWEFPRTDVQISNKRIGQGNFGEVWLATAVGINVFFPRDDSYVAVKAKLANVNRKIGEDDFFFKQARVHFYPGEYSQDNDVAIKMLRQGSTEKHYTDLASELKLMIHIGSHR